MRGNGEQIGPQNLPTSSIAGGIWNLLNQQRAQQRGAWPSATPAVVTDPYFMYVPLLLNTTSTNAQQNNTFLDSGTANGGVGFPITRNGTPTQGSFTPYQPSGYWSGYFNGSTDYLNTPSSASLSFGTSSFTMEMWVYSGANGTGTRLGGNGTGGSWSANNWVIATSTPGNVNKFCLGVNNTSSDLLASTSTFNNNQWMHVAITRSGSSWALFVNGVRESTATNSASLDGGVSKPINLGFSNLSGDSYWAGYISNFRVVIGSAVYSPASTTITVPTSPLTAITNTSLLTLQSNRFIDNSASPLTITVNGTPKVQAFQPFSPAASYSAATYGGSGYFNGTSDYLSLTGNTNFVFGTGDWTVEFWFYLNSIPNQGTFFDLRGSGTSLPGAFNVFGPSGALPNCFTVFNGSSHLQTSGITPVANTWSHIAFSKSSGTLKIFVNGVSYYSASDSTNWSTGNNSIYMARGFDAGAFYISGYISNFRAIKGTGVYTGNFTPPTLAPLTTAGSTSAASYSSTTNVNTSFAAANTSLLTNFTNAGIYDAAWQNNALTVGDAQASTTQYKWSPTSMKFDGTGDYLSLVNNIALDFKSSDWTIEAWVYVSTRTLNYPSIISNNRGSFTTDSLSLTNSNSDNVSYNDKFTLAWGSGGFTSPSLGNAYLLVSNVTNSNNTWYYLAVVRSGTSVKIYRDGSQVASATVSSGAVFNLGYNGTLIGGGNWDGANSYFSGYIQDLRITKGVARTITTPTAAFPTR
jgi:hypothetical protein